VAEIRLEGISHRYARAAGSAQDGDDDHALRDIDLTWEDGGAYALLGPSGCGKTTMLDIISGLLTPTGGRVLIDGEDVTRRPTAARNIAQVFQFPVLYESMTVEQNLRFPLRNRGVAKRDARIRAREIAELLDIDRLLPERARGLPADAKQLVSLARALVRRDVAAILFDEPLTVIDAQRKWGLRQVLKRVHAELNHTLVYVTHDQTEALTFADLVVVMDRGEVLQKGTAEELFDRPAHRFVGHFIGSPGMNFLPCTVTDGVARVAGVGLLALPDGADPGPGPDDVIGVRPDFVRCTPLSAARAVSPLAAEAVAWRDLGAYVLVDLRLAPDELPLIARLPPGAEVPVGRCGVHLEPDRVHLFRSGVRVPGCRPLIPTQDASL
jgi:glycerol transport system ATP-binding protein